MTYIMVVTLRLVPSYKKRIKALLVKPLECFEQGVPVLLLRIVSYSHIVVAILLLHALHGEATRTSMIAGGKKYLYALLLGEGTKCKSALQN